MPRPEGRRFLVMARQPTMPKAVSFLQSVQMLYISDKGESKHSESKEEKGFREQRRKERIPRAEKRKGSESRAQLKS
jgi:hypothetical protein